MATATKKVTSKVVLKEVLETSPAGVLLELSNEEAQAVRDILGVVGGIANTTRRKHTDGVLTALEDAGYIYDQARQDIKGDVYFKADKPGPYGSYLNGYQA